MLDLKNKRVLITGAHGFLGHHVQAALAEHCDLIIAPRSSALDLLDKEEVEYFLGRYQPDIIIHLAAQCGGIGINREKPGEFLYNNMMMTTNLIEASRRLDLDKFVGIGTVCFTKDALIREGHSYKRIDSTTTSCKVTGRNALRCSVVETFCNRYTGELYHIRPYGAEQLNVTSEHPFLVERNHSKIWVQAQHLRGDDRLVIPIYRESHRSDEIEIPQFECGYPVSNLRNNNPCALAEKIRVTPAIARWFGWFMAEGSTNKQGINLYFGEEPELMDDIVSTTNEEFGFSYEPKAIPNQEGYRLDINSYQLRDFCREYFYESKETHRSYTKKIPDFVFGLSNDLQLEFVKSYINGDGHFEYDKRNDQLKSIQITTTSRCLVYQLRDLILQHGIFGNIHHRQVPDDAMILGRKVNARESWVLKWTGQQLDELLSLMFENLSKAASRTSRFNVIVSKDYALVPIYPITSSAVSDLDVYNLGTLDETYTANGVVVHNCSYPKHTPVPFKEEDLYNGYPEETNAPYGIAKRVQLEMLRAYRAQYGLNGIYLIPVNMLGEHDNFKDESSHVIPAMMKKFHRAKTNGDASVTLWGDGSASREFLYAGDCAEAIVKATMLYNDTDPVNIGTGREIMIKELAEKMREVVGYQGDIVWDVTKPNGQPRRCLDVSRARERFGFEAQTSLNEALIRTYQWAQENGKFN